MKFYIAFEKGVAARWLGHLDILRTFERAVRRADLPIAFSTGFNPREKIAFASALPVGVTGSAEVVVIEFAEAIEGDEVVRRLNDKLPSGIQLRSAREIPDAGARDLLNRLDRADYVVHCAAAPGTSLQMARQAVAELRERPEIIVEREKEGRVRRTDVRPYIHTLEADAVENDRVTLRMALTVGGDGSVKASEVVEAIAGLLPGLAARRIHRLSLSASSDANNEDACLTADGPPAIRHEVAL